MILLSFLMFSGSASFMVTRDVTEPAKICIFDADLVCKTVGCGCGFVVVEFTSYYSYCDSTSTVSGKKKRPVAFLL